MPKFNSFISPQFIAAKHIGAHRVSAIALYRALLTQCGAAPLADEARKGLSNAIRNQFRLKRHASGHAGLQDAFARGYHLLDLLDRTTSSDPSISSRVLDYLHAKIPTLSPTLTSGQPPPPRAPKHTPPASKLLSIPDPFPKPGAFLTAPPLPASAFARGRRRTPYLTSANKIPFIRFRKPQPPALSAYINKRVRTRQKRTDRLHECEDLVAVAEREDEWDAILADEHGLKRGAGEEHGQLLGDFEQEATFTEEAQGALDEVSGLINRDAVRSREMGEKMWAFVQREKRLAGAERVEKRKERNRRRAESWKSEAASSSHGSLVDRVSHTV